MHTLNVTVAGLALLFIFVLVSRLVNRSGGGAGGARVFIWVWLFIALANGAMGVLRSGVSPLIEIGVFFVVFCVPAIIAWVAAKKLRTTA
jgi:hypothetical protein